MKRTFLFGVLVLTALFLLKGGDFAVSSLRSGEIVSTITFNPEDYYTTAAYSLENREVVSVQGRDVFPDYVTPGAPLLPVRLVNVLLPEGTDFDGLEIRRCVDVSWRENSVVVPAQPLVVGLDSPLPASVGPNPDIYGFSDMYPYHAIKYVGTATLRGRRIAQLLAYPVRYLPADQRLFVVRTLEFSVRYKPADVSGDVPPMTPLFASIINDCVLNPDPYLFIAASEPKVSCLIVTSRDLIEPFQKFAAYRESRLGPGKIEVIDIAQAISGQAGTDDAERLRSYLKQRLIKDGIEYVILGGDTSVVPIRYVHFKWDHDSDHVDQWPAEAIFSTLEMDWTDDYLNMPAPPVPSVILARIPVRTADHVEAYLGKLKSYERGPFQAVRGKYLLTGTQAFGLPKGATYDIVNDGCSQFKDHDYTDGEMWSRRVFRDGAMINNPPTQVRCLFDKVSSWDVSVPGDRPITVERFLEKANLGWEFLINCSHGYYDGLVLPEKEGKRQAFSVREASSMTNLIAVFSALSCLSGGFDYEPDPCFSEALLRNPKGGALVYHGCSRLGIGGDAAFYGGPSGDNMLALHRRITRTRGPDETLGVAFFKSKIDMAPLGMFDDAEKGHIGHSIINYCVHYQGDPLILAPPPPVTTGLGFTVEAGHVGGAGAVFASSPSVSALRSDSPPQRISLKMISSITKGVDHRTGDPAATALSAWGRGASLWDEKASSANLVSGLKGPDALVRVPFADYETYLNGLLTDGTQLNHAYAGRARLTRPVVWRISYQQEGGSKTSVLNVSGKFFGPQPPEIFVECGTSDGKTIWKPCPVQSYRMYPDASGRPFSSSTDGVTGDSFARAAYPVLANDEKPTGWIIVKNKIGIDAFPGGIPSNTSGETSVLDPLQ